MSLLPSDDIVFDQGWRMFSPVPLELDLAKHKHHDHHIKPAAEHREHRPRKENIGKEMAQNKRSWDVEMLFVGFLDWFWIFQDEKGERVI